MEKENAGPEGLSEERRMQIDARAKTDARAFLEERMRENLMSSKKPKKAPKADTLPFELIVAWEPLWMKAFQELGLSTDAEKAAYRKTFLVEGGYLKI